MFNNVVLIGRLTDKPELRTLDDGTKVCNVLLAVTRPFKNTLGEYDTDFIPVSLWHASALNSNLYCEKGDLVCIKGRLSSKFQEIDNKKYCFIEMIGERIIFLTPKDKSVENKSLEEDVIESED